MAKAYLDLFQQDLTSFNKFTKSEENTLLPWSSRLLEDPGQRIEGQVHHAWGIHCDEKIHKGIYMIFQKAVLPLWIH